MLLPLALSPTYLIQMTKARTLPISASLVPSPYSKYFQPFNGILPHSRTNLSKIDPIKLPNRYLHLAAFTVLSTFLYNSFHNFPSFLANFLGQTLASIVNFDESKLDSQMHVSRYIHCATTATSTLT